LPEFQTYENVSKTYYLINVYYEDLKYTLISQQPKIELFGLISNLGGILGLFIGFSFISLLEIIEALAELVYIYFD
jgi:tetrahydromethanopterin S-methyltransferase subunit F